LHRIFDSKVRTKPDSLVLALVPLAVAVLFLLLLLPRAAKPRDIPLPTVDMRALDRVEGEDRARAQRAKREGLAGDLRELGGAIRTFNLQQARDGDETSLGLARTRLDKVAQRLVVEQGEGALLTLRATQLESFLSEVATYEASPRAPVSDELLAASGTFVTRMTEVGWVTADHRVLMNDHQRRVAFKATWNNVIGIAPNVLALTLDEERALYIFYLEHPHAPIAIRQSVQAARAATKDPRALSDIAQRESAAAEEWRLGKIRELAKKDSSYPLLFSRGVAEYRLGRYEASAQSFQGWLEAHPDGPLALRARNHLKAALDASFD
jgi:hypothetical protein